MRRSRRGGGARGSSHCDASGLFGSRRIERATHRDVAVRSLCAGPHPDPDTLGAFRRRHLAAPATAFVDGLERARELQRLKLGGVSLEGTHLRASASKDQNVPCARAGQLREALRRDVGELPAQAEAGNREGSAKGPEPKPPQDTPEPDEPINFTDADARLMRKSKREGYTQSDNAQAVVDADGRQLIAGRRVSTGAADVGETEADLARLPPRLGATTAALADGGSADKATLERLARERPGLDLYLSVHREDAHAEGRGDWRPLDKSQPPQKLTDPVRLAMAEKRRTPEGKATCRRRARPVEPVFGIIPSAHSAGSGLAASSGPCGKAALGFRQFLRRGLQKVSGEGNLVCRACNCKRRHTLRRAALAG